MKKKKDIASKIISSNMFVTIYRNGEALHYYRGQRVDEQAYKYYLIEEGTRTQGKIDF